MAPRTLLLCSLGTSWAVIPEVYGWLAPRTLDLYAHHPDRAGLDATRASHGLLAPDDLWVCTTEVPSKPPTNWPCASKRPPAPLPPEMVS